MMPRSHPTGFKSIGWKIKDGGHGWLFENDTGPKYRYALATSFGLCEMIYTVSWNEFDKGFMGAFLANKAVIKAGCFMSRRWDCEGRGGCDLLFSNKSGSILFEKKIVKRSQDLTPFKYVQVVHEVKYDEIKHYINTELYLTLKIYGKDERFWAGHYGAKFFGMYIRGDYINSE